MDSLIIFGGQGRSGVICAYVLGYALGGVENMSLAMGEYLRVQALCFVQVELYIPRISQGMQEINEVLRVLFLESRVVTSIKLTLLISEVRKELPRE